MTVPALDDRPRSSARPGGRSARVRAAVLAATLALLSERGYEGTALPDIARRAGVHPTSVYRRWGTKAHVVGEALLEQAHPLTPTPNTGALRGDLQRLLTDGVALVHTPPVRALFEVLLSESSRSLAPDHPGARPLLDRAPRGGPGHRRSRRGSIGAASKHRPRGSVGTPHRPGIGARPPHGSRPWDRGCHGDRRASIGGAATDGWLRRCRGRCDLGRWSFRRGFRTALMRRRLRRRDRRLPWCACVQPLRMLGVGERQWASQDPAPR